MIQRTNIKIKSESSYAHFLVCCEAPPYNNAHGSVELKIGRNNVYVRCKNGQILAHITTTGADGEVLEKANVFGKGKCTNVIVFDVPREIETGKITAYNERVPSTNPDPRFVLIAQSGATERVLVHEKHRDGGTVLFRTEVQNFPTAPRFDDVGEVSHLQRSTVMAPAKEAMAPARVPAPTGVRAPSSQAPAAAPALAPYPAPSSAPAAALIPAPSAPALASVTAPVAAQPSLQQDIQESNGEIKDLLQMPLRQEEQMTIVDATTIG
ncbi:uncharacterized protein LOC119595533 [Penaeus monodon]|uniref:uncharacterized protein LOC119595533 n=1 Tax=Penaeus monodon TaxID=6687 RepID=UPI0018A77920|nr:uncharacterized protein LOC119595533 [Penaeus monodon]